MSRQIIKVNGHYMYDDSRVTRRTSSVRKDQKQGPNRPLICAIVIGLLVAGCLAGAIAETMIRQTKINAKADTLDTENKNSDVRLAKLEGGQIGTITDAIANVSKASADNNTALKDRLDALEKRLEEAFQGNWSAWDAWSTCSASCGVGVTSRRRSCVDRSGKITIQTCIGNDFEVDTCMLKSCTDPASTYVIWGKSSCPANGTEFVYSGFASGGGTANTVCLPYDPVWPNNYNDVFNTKGAPVFGTQYDISNGRQMFSKDVQDLEVPCAVCRPPRPSVVMIPGRNVCYDGWNLEYHGYLMASWVQFIFVLLTEYICVDIDPEGRDGASAGRGEKQLYLVEARCGSLQCPPYVDNREMSCVVCSK